MMTDYEYEKLSEILAEKNEHYSIAFTEQSISVYYNRCRLFELILDEINNPRFLFDGMQQTEIEASCVMILISALKIVQDFVNKNLIHTDLED